MIRMLMESRARRDANIDPERKTHKRSLITTKQSLQDELKITGIKCQQEVMPLEPVIRPEKKPNYQKGGTSPVGVYYCNGSHGLRGLAS